MTMLIVAAAAFLALHLLVAGTKARDTIVGVVGEGPYLGLFSLASAAGLTWLIFAFGGARHDPANQIYWTVAWATRIPVVGLVAIAFLFAVPGLLTNSPTRVRGDSVVDRPNAATGMTRITRHPFLWGVVIWAAAHLIANGGSADLILFGGLMLLALVGTCSIDAKRMRALGERYAAFKAETSNIPFAAILQGRQSLKLSEIWWRLLVGVAVWALILWVHPRAFGGNPLG
ncbi:MAG TPA: NnrU family protein [Caulobacteraceae bacterium]|jgi:uncharacterized membrane protein